jgi:hypothetical protein
MRDAKSWLILVVAVGAVGGWAGCSGQRISTVGEMDTGVGGAGDTPAASAGSKAMAGSGSSSQLPASCADDEKNAGETDIDCGGAECASCPVGASCQRHRDCDSSVCRSGTCQEATCTDGVVNGDESDVDCGGVGLPGEPSEVDGAEPAPSSACPRCDTGQVCRAAADCASIHCANGRCAAATCNDAIKNGAESDVDCGGPSCAPCLDTQYCNVASDCDSGRCLGSRCISCEDGLLNGSETDVDCGGSECGKCAVDAECTLPEDCATGVCQLHVNGRVNRCYPEHCENHIQDADETDLDCGGSECQPCVGGYDCNVNTDCMNFKCESGGCAVPCTNDAECGDQGTCVAKRCVECEIAADCPANWCGDAPCACKHNLCRPD